MIYFLQLILFATYVAYCSMQSSHINAVCTTGTGKYILLLLLLHIRMSSPTATAPTEAKLDVFKIGSFVEWISDPSLETKEPCNHSLIP
jgi:hypothetical protein